MIAPPFMDRLEVGVCVIAACSYACLCEDFSIAAFEKRTNSWACFFVPCPKLVNIEIINLPGYVPVKEVIWTWPRPFCYP